MGPIDTPDGGARRGPGLTRRLALRLVRLLLASFLVHPAAAAQETARPTATELAAGESAGGQVGYRGSGRPGDALFIGRVEAPPRIEDFLSGRPPLDVRRGLTRVEGFLQRNPSDGEPARFVTTAYLGYDDDHLYVVFLAHDPEPELVRARMSRREDIGADDVVSITIDTDRDQQRGYLFTANPFGIQRDALWTEGSAPDVSFDTLWHSEGHRTDDGYVVLMALPFKSLRFPRADVQTWGIVLSRYVPRGTTEESTWPHVSSTIEGRLNQAGVVTGLEQVAPGRNLRFIPYGTFRSFRTLGDTPIGPDFVSDLADPNAGLDAKAVIKDAFVVDATINPDFSQVESDQPQQTVNQRFEVFFPERRPFFLENANYFATPINLLFTRRIADPQFGLRTTGKVGGWALGGLLIDDRAPGLVVPEGDPHAGARARFGVLRVSRDLGAQSNVGLMYVDRAFGGGYNRVAGIDTRVKINDNWVASAQAVASDTLRPDGERFSGPALRARIDRTGRHLTYRLNYEDIGESFRADAGFVPRVGVRTLTQMALHHFRPEGDALIAHGPGFWYRQVFERDGTVVERNYNPWYEFRLAGRTNLGVFFWQQDLTLRPSDYAVLGGDRDYRQRQLGMWFNTEVLPSVSFALDGNVGRRLNFVPAEGLEPALGNGIEGRIELTWRPNERLRLGGSWLHQHVGAPDGRSTALRSEIWRARLDYQFTRELSVRAIAQYDLVAADSEWTALRDARNLNLDLLVTYLINPWTSVYAGLNGNAQNLELVNRGDMNALHRTAGPLLNDSRQFFLKISYLFSY
jgi:hypothetical protein